MTSRDFCYWLQGYFELAMEGNISPSAMTLEQTECVRKHLALVFRHEIDPGMGSAQHQKELTKIHWPQELDHQFYPFPTYPFDPGLRINC